MDTQILEGTFAEVQRRLSALPLKPDTPLRVIVTEPETMDKLPAEPFTPTEFRNGLPLLPRRELPEPITLELVKRLSEDDDEEILRAYRTAGRYGDTPHGLKTDGFFLAMEVFCFTKNCGTCPV